MTQRPVSSSGKDGDQHLVGYVAQLMEISEFELFKRAWESWYAEEIDDAGIEPYFNKYLDFEEVPFWVRNFVRDFLSDEELVEKERDRATLSAFIYYAPLLVFLLLFILIMLTRE